MVLYLKLYANIWDFFFLTIYCKKLIISSCGDLCGLYFSVKHALCSIQFVMLRLKVAGIWIAGG